MICNKKEKERRKHINSVRVRIQILVLANNEEKKKYVIKTWLGTKPPAQPTGIMAYWVLLLQLNLVPPLLFKLSFHRAYLTHLYILMLHDMYKKSWPK